MQRRMAILVPILLLQALLFCPGSVKPAWAQSSAAEATSETTNKTLRLLADRLKHASGDGVSIYYQSSVLTRAADAALALGDKSLADGLLDDCLTRLKSDPKAISGWTLAVQCADRLGKLASIEAIAEESKNLPEAFHDALLLARFRAGDEQALEQFRARKPKVLSFYDALEIADSYIQVGRYEDCEEFVHATEITEENSPIDMISIALANIARKLSDEGDHEAAALWAEKAFGIGGKQFYTGYSLEVLHRKLQGTLTRNYKKFARRAAAYRGHMARELTLNYTSALIENGHFEIAQKVCEGLEDEDDQSRVLRSIVSAQAANGNFREAFALVQKLKTNEAKNAARLAISLSFAKAGREKSAREIADELYSQTALQIIESEEAGKSIAKDQRKQIEASMGLLMGIYAVLGDADKMKEIAMASGTATQKTRRIISGIETL